MISNKDQNCSVDDETALAHHFFTNHQQAITAKSLLPENYFVQVVERPNTNKLDNSENFLISKINEKLNINQWRSQGGGQRGHAPPPP